MAAGVGGYREQHDHPVFQKGGCRCVSGSGVVAAGVVSDTCGWFGDLDGLMCPPPASVACNCCGE
jgi:hypothetical protein